MQISKWSPAVCAALLCVSISVRAEDNAAQAAARAALMKGLNNPSASAPAMTSNNTGSSQPIVVTGASDNSAQAAARAALMKGLNNPAASTPAMTSNNTGSPQPIVVTGASDNSAQAAARAALMKGLNNPSAPAAASASTEPAQSIVIPRAPVVTNAAPAEMPAPTTPVVTRPPAVEKGNGIFSPVPPPSSGSSYDVFQGTAHQPETSAAGVEKPAAPAQMSPSGFSPVPGLAPAEPSNPSSSAGVNDAASALGLPPIQAPPPPVSAEQQSQLQGLLMLYEANQITPEQYQARRAKIMAGK